MIWRLVLGADVNAHFIQDSEIIFSLVRRPRRRCCEGRGRNVIQGRMGQVYQKYGWKMGTDFSKEHTRSGEMDFTESSKEAILKHVEEGWQESLTDGGMKDRTWWCHAWTRMGHIWQQLGHGEQNGCRWGSCWITRFHNMKGGMSLNAHVIWRGQREGIGLGGVGYGHRASPTSLAAICRKD